MTIGILGYGNFGQALGGLLTEGGYPFKALDPVAPVPAGNSAGDLRDLVAGVDFLALAVPILLIGLAAPWITALRELDQAPSGSS